MLQVHSNSLYKSIFVLAAVVLGLAFVYYIHNVLMLFVFGAVVAYSLNPIISWLHRRKVPRTASVIIVISLLLACIVIGFSFLIPAIVTQIQEMIDILPTWVEAITSWWKGMVRDQPFLASYHLDADALVQQATDATTPMLSMVQSLITWTVGLMVSIVIALYALVSPHMLGDSALRVVPPQHKELALRLASQINSRIGGWLRGIIIISFATVVVSFIFYEFVFHLPFSLTLAVLTALLEIIPIVGPIAAGVVVAGVAFLQNPVLGVWTIVFITAWRLATDYLLAPKVMNHHVGLHPLTVIFAALTMAELLGPIGLFLAVPIAATIKILIEEVYLPFIHRKAETEAPPVPDEA